MSLLGLITARGGSKGLPRKNLLEICGKPLIAWTIENAKKSKHIDHIVVSTEDEEIAEIAQIYGAEVPFMRPNELAQDNSIGMEVVHHALEELSEFEDILWLQPTSPLRNKEDIDGIVDFCKKKKAPAAISVCESSKHPNWMFSFNEDDVLLPFTNNKIVYNRQELPKIYTPNGALYFAKTKWLKKTQAFYSDETLGYIMPAARSVDIDSPLDFKLAEFLLNESIKTNNSNLLKK